MLPTAALCLHLLFFSLMPQTFLRLNSLSWLSILNLEIPRLVSTHQGRAASFCVPLCSLAQCSTHTNPTCLNLCAAPLHLHRPKPFSCMPRVQVLKIHFCNRTFLGISCNSSMCWQRGEVLFTFLSISCLRCRVGFVHPLSGALGCSALSTMSQLHQHKLFVWSLLTPLQLLLEELHMLPEHRALTQPQEFLFRGQLVQKNPNS